MDFSDIPLALTPKELAKITGEHEGTIRRGIVEGRIPADKVNGRWIICRDAIFPNAKEALRKGYKQGAANSLVSAGSAPEDERRAS